MALKTSGGLLIVSFLKVAFAAALMISLVTGYIEPFKDSIHRDSGFCGTEQHGVMPCKEMPPPTASTHIIAHVTTAHACFALAQLALTLLASEMPRKWGFVIIFGAISLFFSIFCLKHFAGPNFGNPEAIISAVFFMMDVVHIFSFFMHRVRKEQANRTKYKTEEIELPTISPSVATISSSLPRAIDIV